MADSDDLHPPGDPRLTETLPDTTGTSGAPSLSPQPQDHPRYRFGAVLGQGSSASVFAARDLVFDRPVAVKVLAHPEGGAIARFIREARITALLDHPNVVTVHDLAFDDGGRSFLVMKHIEGQSLGDALLLSDAGRHVPAVASVNAVLGIALKVCDALSRAHARGIFHRDVKPDNIMLGSDGEVMLVDWGEASVASEDSGSRRGTPVGTPLYMSPEQARGEKVGPASDIYGLGATIFRALIGRPPLKPDDLTTFMRRRTAGAIDLPDAQEQARIPAPLLAILIKALSGDAAHRYRTVAALRDDLLNFQAGLAITAFREGPLSRMRRWARLHRGSIATGLAILVVAVAATWFVIGERLKEYATWGAPILVEPFADEHWRERWREVEAGSFSTRNGWLASNARDSALLLLDRMLVAPVAVEYTARFEAGAQPGDVSLWWCETNQPVKSLIEHPGFLVQFGGSGNRCCQITRTPDFRFSDFVAHGLDATRPHRLRVEFEDDQVTAFLDGRELMCCRDLLPLRSGRIALSAWHPGKAFRDLRIYRKEIPERISSLTLGDRALRAGTCDEAVAEYALVMEAHPGKDIAEEARYRQGLALLTAGRDREATVIWKGLTDIRLTRFAEALQIGRLCAAGRHRIFIDRFINLWNTAPECRSLLRQHWWGALDQVLRLPAQAATALLPLYATASDTCFSDDLAMAPPIMRLLVRLGRNDEALQRFRDHPITGTWIRQRMGRNREVLSDPRIQALDDEKAFSYWGLGRLDEVSALPSATISTIQHVLAKQERLREARVLAPNPELERFAEMDAATRAQVDPAGAAYAAALDQLRQVAEGLADAVRVERLDDTTRILMRREEDPEAFPGQPLGQLLQVRLLRTWEDGRVVIPADLAALEKGVVLAASQDAAGINESGWFMPWFAVPVVAGLNGDRQRFGRAMETVLRNHAESCAQRPLLLARFLAGACDRSALQRMPVRSEAEAWSLLGTGMKAELELAPGAALEAYRSFQRLPLHRRLLSSLTPDPLVERFVAWRIRTLRVRP